MTNSEQPLNITLDEEEIEHVTSYTYLGHNIKIGKENQGVETNRRVTLRWVAFYKVSYVLKSRTFHIGLKSKILDTCILPV